MGLFDNNAVVRWTVRKGTESERRVHAQGFLQGELVYTTDGKRLFVGTGDNSETLVPVSPKLCETTSEMLHRGDFVIDRNASSITFKTGTDDRDIFTLSAGAPPDGTTIVNTGGALSVKALPGTAVDTASFSVQSGKLKLKDTLAISKITGSSLALPPSVSFGPLSLDFSTTSAADTPFTIGLKKTGTSGNRYTAAVVDMPQGGGGGDATTYSFSENFDTVSSAGGKRVEVDLAANLTGVSSIGNSKGERLDLDSLTDTLSADYGVALHLNDDLSYSLVRTGTETGGSGSIVLLEKPLFLCWSGTVEGAGDTTLSAKMEFTVDPYVFCNRKRMSVAGQLPPFDAESGEDYESATYVAKLEDESEGARAYDYWNNSILVLGRNNYMNLVQGGSSTIESPAGTVEQPCLTHLNGGVLNPQLFEQEEIAVDSAGKAKSFASSVVPLEVLRGQRINGIDLVFARTGAGSYAASYAAVSKIEVDGTEIPFTKGDDGAVSVDTLEGALQGGWDLTVNGGATYGIHEAVCANAERRTLSITIPAGGEVFRYKAADGSLERLKFASGETEKTINASDCAEGDYIVSRTGSPAFTPKSVSDSFPLASTANYMEARDADGGTTYEAVSFKDAFQLVDGALKPKDSVTVPADYRDGWFQPVEWTLSKKDGDNPETPVETPFVKTFVVAHPALDGAVVGANDINDLQRLGFAAGAAGGELWEESSVPLEGPSKLVKLYNAKKGRVAYSDSIDKMHRYKNPTGLFVRKPGTEDEYEAKETLSINKRGLSIPDGTSGGFKLLAYVPAKNGQIDPDRLAEASLTESAETLPALLEYNWNMENTNAGEVLELEKENLFMDVFSEGAHIFIGDSETAIPSMFQPGPSTYEPGPTLFTSGPLVCSVVKTMEEQSETPWNIDKLYLRKVTPGKYPDRAAEADARYILAPGGPVHCVQSATAGYTVSQYAMSKGRFLTDSMVVEPGVLNGVKLDSSHSGVKLDETVAEANRVSIAGQARSVLLEVKNGQVNASPDYAKSLLYGDSFDDLAVISPEMPLPPVSWYTFGPDSSEPYTKGSGSSYSYTVPGEFARGDGEAGFIPVAPASGETIAMMEVGRDSRVIEVPLVDNKFYLRAAGCFKAGSYGDFSVRLVGYRKK